MAAVSSQVTGTVDPTTGALSITASSASPKEAQAIAKAYSEAYVNETQNVVNAQSDKISTALTALDAKLAGLESLPPTGAVTAQINGLEQTVGALQTEQENITLGEPYASTVVAAGPELPRG